MNFRVTSFPRHRNSNPFPLRKRNLHRSLNRRLCFSFCRIRHPDLLELWPCIPSSQQGPPDSSPSPTTKFARAAYRSKRYGLDWGLYPLWRHLRTLIDVIVNAWGRHGYARHTLLLLLPVWSRLGRVLVVPSRRRGRVESYDVGRGAEYVVLAGVVPVSYTHLTLPTNREV